MIIIWIYTAEYLPIYYSIIILSYCYISTESKILYKLFIDSYCFYSWFVYLLALISYTYPCINYSLLSIYYNWAIPSFVIAGSIDKIFIYICYKYFKLFIHQVFWYYYHFTNSLIVKLSLSGDSQAFLILFLYVLFYFLIRYWIF